MIGIAQQVARGIGDWNLRAVALGTLSLIVVGVGRRVSRKAPGPLIAVVMCGLAVAMLGYGNEDLMLIGRLPVLLKTWPMPDLSFATLERLLPAGLALALLGAIETHAIAKSLARRTGHTVSSNQDMFGQGVVGMATSFVACIPGSTSLTRSALNQSAGARTLLANIVCSLFVAAGLFLLADAARFIPIASIAGILLIVAWSLVDWSYIRRVVRTSKADSSVMLATFIATLVIPLEYAVLVGILLNIALYLQRATQLQMKELVRNDSGAYVERPVLRDSDAQQRLIQVEGSLFFAQAEEWEEQLDAIHSSPAHAVVVRIRRVHSIDSTMLSVFDQFVRRMRSQGRHVLLCGVHRDILARLTDFGLLETLGEENVFETSEGVFASAESALRRADELVRAP